MLHLPLAPRNPQRQFGGPQLACPRSVLLVAFSLTALSNSTPAQEVIAVGGIISQGSPIVSYVGFTAGVGTRIPIARVLFVSPSITLSGIYRTGDDIALCVPVDTGDCLAARKSESQITGASSLGFQVGRRSAVQPFLEAGVSFTQSLASENPGEKRQYFAPLAALGIRVPSAIGAWSFSGRLRRINRWRPQDTHSEFSLLVGYSPGRR